MKKLKQGLATKMLKKKTEPSETLENTIAQSEEDVMSIFKKALAKRMLKNKKEIDEDKQK